MKKTTLICCALCAAVVCLYILTLFAGESQANIIDNISYVILLDAGHGGIDGGVTGKTTGVKESDLNIAITKLIEEEFTSNGFKVVLTRKDKNGLYGSATKQRKKIDMRKRREIIAACNPDLVISIHQNSSTAAYRKGAQVFYQSNDDDSSEFAKAMQDYLTGKNIGSGAAQGGDFYILRCCGAPGIIVECGFLTNSEDEVRLQDKEYQKQLARAVFMGAVVYLFK